MSHEKASMDRGSKPKPKASPRRRVPDTKSQRIPIKSAQQRPHSFYSTSCPQPRFLNSWPWNQHYGKDTWPWERQGLTNSSPGQKRQVRASSDTVATCRMTSSMYATDRPSTAQGLPYEGGVFGSSEHSAKRDFFVIHPDWVSEAKTVKKLTLSDRKPRQIYSATPRRSRSAPPPRFRNPITWQE